MVNAASGVRAAFGLRGGGGELLDRLHRRDLRAWRDGDAVRCVDRVAENPDAKKSAASDTVDAFVAAAPIATPAH